MGFGDSLIVASIVKKAKLRHPDKPIVVGDGTQIRWCEVFDNNPKIAREITPGCLWVHNTEGRRPYIDYRYSTPTRMEWVENCRCEPGELYLTDEETDWLDRDFVYIEPNTKSDSIYKNKDWGFDKWQRVVDLLPDVRFVQGSGRRLAGVAQRDTKSFRHACGLLLHADLFVGPDGGMHHAAAALGKPAVLVWGGLINPLITGYADQTILCKAKRFCGNLNPCAHCREALDAITPEMVASAITSRLQAP